MNLAQHCLATAFTGMALAFTPVDAEDFNKAPFKVDARSAHMGALGSLAEMVRLDVKQLGLGAPVSSEEMDIILPVVQQIAERNGVHFYRETDFLVTDLYASDVTNHKEVIFIYKGDTLDRYLALKKEKARLIETGLYDRAAHMRVAGAFGELLSYPAHTIMQLIANNTEVKTHQ